MSPQPGRPPEDDRELSAARRRAAAGTAAFLLAAPGTVAGLVPWLLTRWRASDPPPPLPVRGLGALLVLGGAFVLLHSFARFVVDGLGTPARVAPTRRLVVTGWYRHVRNPMYVAIVTVVLGQAALLGRAVLLAYALATWVVPAGFVRLYEEPTLARTYGEEYEHYRRAVPAWLPRLRPWSPRAGTGPHSDPCAPGGALRS